MAISILILDDDLHVLDTIGAHLSPVYEIHTADDVDVALNTLTRHKIDMLISSTKLPSRSGFAFIKDVRNLDKYIDLPVILISDVVSQEFENKGKGLNVVALLQKPVDLNNLNLLISDVFQNQKSVFGQDKMTSQSREILSALRILLVDDDVNILEVMKEKLEISVHRVITADSVDKATDYLQDKDIDVIISDVELPKKDGFELVSWINNNPSTAGISIILMSGVVTDVEIIHKAKSLWVDKYLIKPFEFDLLIQNIVEICDRNYRLNKLIKLNNSFVQVLKTREKTYKTRLEKLREKISEVKSKTAILNGKIKGLSQLSKKKEVSELRELRKILEGDARTLQEYINLSQTEYLADRQNIINIRRSLQKQVEILRNL